MSTPNTTDTINPPYNPLPRSSRSSRVIIDGVSVPLEGAPLLSSQKSPVNYMITQRTLTETVDITHDTPVHAYMHTRTTAILLHTFTPPVIGTTLPTYSDMLLIRCAVFSSATDMSCYELDVNSTDGFVLNPRSHSPSPTSSTIFSCKQETRVDDPTSARSPFSAAISLTAQTLPPGTPIPTPPLSSLNAPTFSIGLLTTSTTNSPISISLMPT